MMSPSTAHQPNHPSEPGDSVPLRAEPVFPHAQRLGVPAVLGLADLLTQRAVAYRRAGALGPADVPVSDDDSMPQPYPADRGYRARGRVTADDLGVPYDDRRPTTSS
jgi:hypothetical protein